MIIYTATPTSLSVLLDWQSHVIPSSHPNFAKLKEMVRQKGTTEDQIRHLIDIPKAINTFTGGNVTVVGGRLFYKGFEVKNTLASIILKFVRDGDADGARPFELFMEKAYANPDPRAVEGLYDWVVAGGLPITPDGEILAWKAVQADYFSIASGPRGKLRHEIGDVVEEPRHETNSDPSQTCSRGIHFCSLEYLKSGGYARGGSRIMAVKISPTDVVAFPKDYKLSKGRCCRLTVVGEVPMDKVPNYYPTDKIVYSGWEPASQGIAFEAPATEPKTPQVGEVWKMRNGDLVEVIPGSGTTVPVLGVKFADGRETKHHCYLNGRTMRAKLSPHDLVEFVGRGELTQKLDIKVRQKWKTRDGSISEIMDTPSHQLKAGVIYTSTGTVFKETGGGAECAAGQFLPETNFGGRDLKELVEDVKQPQVGEVWKTRNGRLAEVIGVDKHNLLDLRIDGVTYPGYLYRNGRAYSDGSEHVLDLVERIGEGEVSQPRNAKAGQKWRLRDGRIVVLGQGSSGDPAYVRAGMTVLYASTGLGRYPKVSGVFVPKTSQSKHDLIEMVEDVKQTPRNEHGFAVGQVWQRRDGLTVKITLVGNASDYPLRDDMNNTYTASGRYNSTTTTSAYDLVKLVKDVD